MADEEKQENKEAEEENNSSKDEEKPQEESPASEKADSGSSQDEEAEEVEVPKEFADMIEKIEKMSVLELNQLVKVLEKKFGVSAQATVVAGAATEAGGGEEKSEFNVELASAGDNKIQVIKAVKEALGLGLKEAKDIVDGAPAMLKEGMNKEEAEELKNKVEEAGGKIELK